MKKTLLALTACMAVAASGYAQFSENFEITVGSALPTGWTQEVAAPAIAPNDSVGWNAGTNTTLGSSDFPIPAHTRFIAVNDDKYPGAANSNTFVSSPSFSLGSGSWWLKFECLYMNSTYSGATEAGTVEVSTNGGTTWTVASTLTGNSAFAWETKYVDLSAYAGMPDVRIGFRYKDNAGWLFGYAVDDISVFAPPATEMELQAIAPGAGDPRAYGLGGSNISVLGQVKNNGSSTITSYNVKYVFNGGAVVTNAVTGASIAPFTTATFTATTPVTLPAAVGQYPLLAWIELAGDADATNDTAGETTLFTAAFMPVKKLVMEEGTGTWCQWCPRGAVYMDSMHTLYGNDVSLIAVHNNDPMEVAAYDTWMGGQIGGYPSAVVDRMYELDPSDLPNAYDVLHENFAFADITVAPTLAGTSLSAAVTVRPAVNINGAKLALVITEDDLHGTTSGWAQANAYSGSSTSFLTGGGVNYNALPNPIPAAQMYYNHVARSIDPSPTGGAGLVPAAMVHSTDYSYTFNKTLDATWVTNKVHGVVMLLDGTNGSVLNSQNFDLALGISNVDAGVENFVVVPNPASSVANMVFDLKNSGNVQVTVVDMLGRIVYAAPAARMTAGTARISVPVAEFANGMYNVKVQTENGTIAEKFNVIR